jgi:hypothetical protein
MNETKQTHPQGVRRRVPDASGITLSQCGNCGKWTCHTDARMPDHGECAHRPVGHYSHRQSACLFNPTRWSAK